MVSAIVVELPSSDEEEEKVPEVKPKASKGMICLVFTTYFIPKEPGLFGQGTEV